MTTPTESRLSATDDAARFRKRLMLLGAIALAGMAALTARLVWLHLSQ